MYERTPQNRYLVAELLLSGELYSVEPLKPYGDGKGALRSIVILADGPDGKTYIPVTLFNEDAKSIADRGDTRRDIKCTARLISRQYISKDGSIRWGVSFTGSNVILGASVRKDKSNKENNTVTIDDPQVADILN